jgi:hypothetical protein
MTLFKGFIFFNIKRLGEKTTFCFSLALMYSITVFPEKGWAGLAAFRISWLYNTLLRLVAHILISYRQTSLVRGLA